MKVKARRKDGLNAKAIGGLTLDDLEFFVDDDVVATLNEDIDQSFRMLDENIVGQISHQKIRKVEVKGVVILDSETSIAHNLGSTPTDCNVREKSDGYAWETRDADSRFVYLQANTTVTADVIVYG
jgi:hypothetical protein